jgi:hypothetical protein
MCIQSHNGPSTHRPIDLPACVLIGEPYPSYIPAHKNQNTNLYACNYSSSPPCQGMTATNERDATVQLKLDRGLGLVALHPHKDGRHDTDLPLSPVVLPVSSLRPLFHRLHFLTTYNKIRPLDSPAPRPNPTISFSGVGTCTSCCQPYTDKSCGVPPYWY